MKNKLLLEIERQKKLMGISKKPTNINESVTGPGPWGWGGLFLKKLLTSTDAAVTGLRSRFENIYDNLTTKTSLARKNINTFDEMVDDVKNINTSRNALVKGTNDEYLDLAKEFVLKIFRETGNDDMREIVLGKYKDVFNTATKKVLQDMEDLAISGNRQAFDAARRNAERGGNFDPQILNYLESKIPRTDKETFIDPKGQKYRDEDFENYIQRQEPEDQMRIRDMMNMATNGDYDNFIQLRNDLTKPLPPEILRHLERGFKIDVPNPTFWRNMWEYISKRDLITGKVIGGIVRKLAGIRDKTMDELQIQFRNIVDDIANDAERGIKTVNPQKLEQLNQLSRKISEFDRAQVKSFWDETKELMPQHFLNKVEKPNGNFDDNIFKEWINFYNSASGEGSFLLPPMFTSKLQGFWRLLSGADEFGQNGGFTKAAQWVRRLERVGRFAYRGTFRINKEIATNQKLLGAPVSFTGGAKFTGYQVGELVMSTVIYAPVTIGLLSSLWDLLDKGTEINLPLGDEETWSGGETSKVKDNPLSIIKVIAGQMFKDMKLDPISVLNTLSKGYSPALYKGLSYVLNIKTGGAPTLTKDELIPLIQEIKIDTSANHKVLMENEIRYNQVVTDTLTSMGFDVNNMDSVLNDIFK